MNSNLLSCMIALFSEDSITMINGFGLAILLDNSWFENDSWDL